MKVIKMITNGRIIVFAGRLEIIPQYLSKEHLSDSDHASPACISHERCLVSAVFQQFWKARAVSNPDNIFKSGGKLLVNLVNVGRIAGKLLPKQKCRLVSRQCSGKWVLFEDGHCFVFEVVGKVFYLLGKIQRPSKGRLHQIITSTDKQ